MIQNSDSTPPPPPQPREPQVKLWVQPRRPRLWSSAWWRVGSWLVVCSTATLAGVVIWSGARLIIAPDHTNWLTTVFPMLGKNRGAPWQSLAAIRTDLAGQGLVAGEPLRLDRQGFPGSKSADWILPIQKAAANCQVDCAGIIELHIYRARQSHQSDRQYQLIQQVKLPALKEDFVTAPLIGTAAQVANVPQRAPLTELAPFENPLDDHPWLLLEGQKNFGHTVMRYGQLLYYAPRTAEIHILLSWSSPADQRPVFKDLDGVKPPELIVNQTVGLDPHLQGYQILATDPPQIKEISLLRSVYPEPLSNSLYDKALVLARGGVWVHALQMMQSARTALGDDWTAAATAQLNLMAVHAAITTQQADRQWSSQRQQLLAYLMDSRWQTVLQSVEADPESYAILQDLLKKDFERLWNRIQAHLKIHPDDEAAQLLGALSVTARQSPAAGKTWLSEQTTRKAHLDRLAALLSHGTSGATADVNLERDQPASATNALTPVRYQRLLGSVVLSESADGDWQLATNPLPPLTADQIWYQIDVRAFYDQQGWQTAPDFSGVTEAKDSLWRWVGLHHRPNLRVLVWNTAAQAQPISVNIVGLRMTETSLMLLGVGPRLDDFSATDLAPLAMTENSLQWLDQTAGTSLRQLLQTDSLWTEIIPPALETFLGTQSTTTLYPYWRTHYLDVTGDSNPELFLTLFPHEVPERLVTDLTLNRTGPRTLIFSPTGDLLYNDLTTNQSILALTQETPGRAIPLLVYEADRGYFLERLN